jgi:hypothetical protein
MLASIKSNLYFCKYHIVPLKIEYLFSNSDTNNKIPFFATIRMRARQIIAQIKNISMNCSKENGSARQIIEGNTLLTYKKKKKKIEFYNSLIK